LLFGRIVMTLTGVSTIRSMLEKHASACRSLAADQRNECPADRAYRSTRTMRQLG
jgi:hypothetical protein